LDAVVATKPLKCQNAAIMKVLVTGGCGYIGSATSRWLRARGVDVQVIDDLSEGHRQAWDGPLEVLDLLDRDALHAYLKGKSYDGVIHFAARCYVGESVDQPVRYWRSNVVPVIHLCEALEGVPFVLSSTCATYGEPQTEALSEDHPQFPVNPYGATKLADERLLKDRDAAGLGKCTLLRYFNAAGASECGQFGEAHDPETHLIPLAVESALGSGRRLTVFGTDWPTPDGTCVRDYIHVDDLAQAHFLALERMISGGDSGAWNLGTGNGFSVREIIDAVEIATGKSVPHDEGPRRAGDPARLIADSRKARHELGWKPKYENAQQVVDTAVAWHLNHPTGYQSS
jgi:UDP-glucose 4-epimerase